MLSLRAAEFTIETGPMGALEAAAGAGTGHEIRHLGMCLTDRGGHAARTRQEIEIVECQIGLYVVAARCRQNSWGSPQPSPPPAQRSQLPSSAHILQRTVAPLARHHLSSSRTSSGASLDVFLLVSASHDCAVPQ